MASGLGAYEVIELNHGNNIHFEHSVVSSSYVALHYHDAIEIISVRSGELTVSTDKGQFHLHGGQCILLSENVLHSTISKTGNDSILLQVPTPFLERDFHLENRNFIWDPLTTNPMELAKIGQVQEILQRMLELEEEKPSGYMLLFLSRLFDLLYILQRDFSYVVSESELTAKQRNYSRLFEILDYTEQHYAEPLQLETVASQCHLQANYFCRFFKQNTGMTYRSYLNEFRLSKLYYDLVMTDQPLKVLLERHGFTNPKTFRSLFYARFGKTPSQLRAELK